VQPSGAAAPTGGPTCYRHPDRETYIRCTRCDRPICPDCMVEASVGFQCPECVREGSKGQREWRTAYGGRVAGKPGRVSLAILIACVAFFIAQTAVGPRLENDLWLWGGGVAQGEWWRLLTAAFLHDGIFHIGFNMYALWIVGPQLEASLGRLRFAALYLLAALGGSAASYAWGDPRIPSLGASGAVFGLFGAYLVISRRLRLDASALYVLLGINIVLGFVISGIDWRAHLGGLVTGAALAAIFAYAPRQKRALVQAVGGILVAVAVVGLVLWRTADIWQSIGAPDASMSQVARCAVTTPLADESFVGCMAQP
jgi:membrane associated rhomboid family serine protease